MLEVNVSDRAQELASGAAKLEALRVSVRNGTFQIDPHAIAARLVGEDEG
jgi:anti-sigma28 factor (negative regulator of flagellin synthesis)